MRGLFLSTAILCVLGSVAAAEDPLKITHGPMLGRLSQDGIGVWARTSRPGSFQVYYGTSPDLMNRVATAPASTLDHDNTSWVHITGLKPDTKYWYELATADGRRTRGGSFRTLPSSNELRDPRLNPRGLFNFRFEYACGNNQAQQHGSGTALPAFKTMLDKLDDRIDFAILNGDWLYEEARDYTPEQWLRQVGRDKYSTPATVEIAPAIVGVWQNYKNYLDHGKNLVAWHREVPSFFTFDDHEILNDVWGAGTPGLRDRRAVFRDVGVQAWYDYLGWSNPVEFTQGITFGKAELKAGSDLLIDKQANFRQLDLTQAGTLLVHWGTKTDGVNDNALDGVGGDPNAGVYAIAKVIDDHTLQISPAADQTRASTYSIGRRSYFKKRIANCDFFFCDTRTHRQMHDTRQPDKPGLSMLGEQQKQWLLAGLQASDADFLFVVSSVNFMVPHVGGGSVRTSNKDDAWTVFFDEREQLINAFDKIGKPVLVMTGDLHNSFVIKITDRVWEFASGPHNSNNHWYTDEGNRPATGKFKYGPRECDIRWSTLYRDDIPRENLSHPAFCVVQVNNVYNNPLEVTGTRWVAFERPQVIFQYYSGRTGDLLYAESIVATDAKPAKEPAPRNRQPAEKQAK